ncbi:hypothetical protein OI70_18990 [Dickeya fangzhongdai]|nr:hypothetical protein OI70_18990 [Dickeya fangzhongdai]
MTTSSVIFYSFAGHGVLYPLVKREDGAVTRYRDGVGAGQMRKYIHDEIRIWQTLELSVNLIGRGACVVWLADLCLSSIAVGQRAAQALAGIKPLTLGLVFAAATTFLMPDVLHGLAVMGKQFLLAGGTAIQHGNGCHQE